MRQSPRNHPVPVRRAGIAAGLLTLLVAAATPGAMAATGHAPSEKPSLQCWTVQSPHLGSLPFCLALDSGHAAVAAAQSGQRTVATAASATPTPATANGSCQKANLQAIARAVEPSVLLVTARHGTDSTTGTGFVIRSDALGTFVVTSLHTVQGASRAQITITAPGKAPYAAHGVIVSTSAPGSAGDLAVVRMQATTLRPLAWGDSAQLTAGQDVASIGYDAGAGGPPSVLRGTVSAVRRELHDGAGPFWIQHQTSIDLTGTGGPLLDGCGNVVGINTRGKFVPVAGHTAQVQGIYYAIPSNNAQRMSGALVAALLAGKSRLAVNPALSAPPATATRTPAPTATATVTATSTAEATLTATATAPLPSATATPSATPMQPAAATASPTPQSSPTATGVAEATTLYNGADFTVDKPDSWLATGSAEGPTVFSSPDDAVQIVIAVGAVSYLPTPEQIKAAIEQAANDIGTQGGVSVSVTYQPLTIGTLTGLTGKLTVSGSTNTYYISAVGDGQHLVLITETLHAAATPAEIDQATQLIASIQVTDNSV